MVVFNCLHIHWVINKPVTQHMSNATVSRVNTAWCKNKNHPVSSSSLDVNALLLRDMRGEWPDWFENPSLQTRWAEKHLRKQGTSNLESDGSQNQKPTLGSCQPKTRIWGYSRHRFTEYCEIAKPQLLTLFSAAVPTRTNSFFFTTMKIFDWDYKALLKLLWIRGSAKCKCKIRYGYGSKYL